MMTLKNLFIALFLAAVQTAGAQTVCEVPFNGLLTDIGGNPLKGANGAILVTTK